MPLIRSRVSLDLFSLDQASDVTRHGTQRAHAMAAAKAKIGMLSHVTKPFRWAEEIRSTLGGFDLVKNVFNAT